MTEPVLSNSAKRYCRDCFNDLKFVFEWEPRFQFCLNQYINDRNLKSTDSLTLFFTDLQYNDKILQELD